MKKLAILGASYLQQPLVEKAKAMGLETICFAWDSAEAVCKGIAHQFYPISVLDKDLILEKCRELDIDGITTIATDICVPTICYVAEKLDLTSNSVASGFMSTNKAAMRKAFEDHGVNSPKSVKVQGYAPDLFENLQFPLIVKPSDRSGSRGVTKVLHKDALESAISTAISESLANEAVVEEFIGGHEVSVECISFRGTHHFLAITDKVTTGGPHFVELEHHQPSFLPSEIKDAIRRETFKALDALSIQSGASHSEFMITPHGKVIAIEVGARMGGDFIGSHLTELSTGYDFLKGVIDVALGQLEKPEITKTRFSGVYFLCEETKHLKPYFYKHNDFEVAKEILRPELHHITNSNDRSGYLIYESGHKIEL